MIVDAQSNYAIGVDVGGTKINAGLVSEQGDVLVSVSMSTLVGQCKVMDRIIEAVDALAIKASEHAFALRVRGIGVGTAGQVQWPDGQIRFASDILPGYTGTPVKQILQERFGLPVYVDNDVNVLAITEKRLGSGICARHVICLALGTGVGGVVLLDGRIMHGTWGGAGELGHMSVDFRGQSCVCGSRGCLEQYASGTGIAARMKKRLMDEGLDTPFIDSHEVWRRWKAGDPVATEIMLETIAALGAAVCSLIHIFNPDVIIIGGGISEAGDELFDPLRKEVSSRSMAALSDSVRIVPAYKGNLNGMIGAALQHWEYKEGQVNVS